MVSPRFGEFPSAALLGAPTVASDSDIPTPGAGVSCFYNTTDGLWRLKLPNGSVVDIGPTDIPTSTDITARAIASIDGTSGTPAILFQRGNSEGHPSANLFTGITRVSPGVFDLACTASLGNTDTVAVVTARPAGGAAVIATYSLANSPDVFVQTWDAAGTATDADFSITLYTSAG
jgi:hypothetical protein